MTKEFAANRERTEEGWILYPSDIAYRKRLPFPDEVFEHPAKAQLYLLEDIVEFVSKKGDVILDPFGGTGSMLVATLMDRPTVMIELEDHFVNLIHEAIDGFRSMTISKTVVDGYPVCHEPASAMVITGDNRQILPISCDHAIFSPPYSDILKGTGMKNVGRGVSDEAMKKYAGEAASPLNLGRMSQFLYAQHMKRVYKLLGQSVRPGGTMTILIKDRMRQGKREHLSEACIKACNEAGFKLQDWFKWKAPGVAQQKLMKSKGFTVVEDEDILIMRKV